MTRIMPTLPPPPRHRHRDRHRHRCSPSPPSPPAAALPCQASARRRRHRRSRIWLPGALFVFLFHINFGVYSQPFILFVPSSPSICCPQANDRTANGISEIFYFGWIFYFNVARHRPSLRLSSSVCWQDPPGVGRGVRRRRGGGRSTPRRGRRPPGESLSPGPGSPARPPSHCCWAPVRGRGFGEPDRQPCITFPFLTQYLCFLFNQPC